MRQNQEALKGSRTLTTRFVPPAVFLFSLFFLVLILYNHSCCPSVLCSNPLQSRKYYFLSEEAEDDLNQRCRDLEHQVRGGGGGVSVEHAQCKPLNCSVAGLLVSLGVMKFGVKNSALPW